MAIHKPTVIDGQSTVRNAQKALAISPPTETPTGTTETIDWDNGQAQILDLGSASGDVTLTLSNPVAGESYLLKIIQGATARDVVLPSTVKMSNGLTAPHTLDISSGNDDVDVLTLFYDGTNYLAQFDQDYA